MARSGSMFFRMMMRAALVRKGRAIAALLAVVVAAGVATAMLNLYVDVQAKLEKEFRNYGANIIVVAKNDGILPADVLTKIDAALAGRGIAVPFTYAVATTLKGAPVVVAGTDFDRAKQLNHYWSVSTWPSGRNTALLGSRAQDVLTPKSEPFTLVFQNKTVHLTPAGTVITGSEEDSRVYLAMNDFTAWTGLGASTIEVGASGTAQQIEAIREQIESVLPNTDVKPVRQIVEAESRVLGKARASLLASAVVIVVTAILCVLATLTAWVLEQRKNFAIMKALGASERIVTGLFAAEAATLGAVGALFGFAVGIGAAAWIARANFHASVTPRLSVFPIVLAGSIALALVAAMIPIGLLHRVQPATILRGE